MICLNCGNEIAESSQFCTYCGTVIQPQQPAEPQQASEPPQAAEPSQMPYPPAPEAAQPAYPQSQDLYQTAGQQAYPPPQAPYPAMTQPYPPAAQSPYTQQQSPYAQQQSPYAQQQTPYPAYGQPYATEPQPKKKTGLVIGLVVGAVALIALVIGGFFLISNLLNPDTPVIEKKDPPITQSPTAYKNDLIGISIEIPNDWEAVEGVMYPDEVLGIYSLYSDDDFIWIDRYAEINYKDYMRDYFDFSIYTGGLGGKISKMIVDSEKEVINGVTWERYCFILDCGDEEFFIDLYITQMPNDRGVFNYAAIHLLGSNGQQDLNAYAETMMMLESLRFIR
ncbi:MAG: zinc-ribbon domain-containing protein [Coriobacteriia bacterium]|nr:zinc-ribbon domain-containing protein [Coriobacteriia bacterium]